MKLSAAVLAAALVVSGCNVSTAGEALRKPQPAEGEWFGTIEGHVDGDTIDVELDSGERIRVRLADINTADDGECWVDEASGALAYEFPIGESVRVKWDGSMSYDRHVADLSRLSDGYWANGGMVANGHARYTPYKPTNEVNEAELGRLEGEAANHARGMWDACTIEEMPS